jgi:hypothetical protein
VEINKNMLMYDFAFFMNREQERMCLCELPYSCMNAFFFFFLPAQVSELSITGRDQTAYTVHDGYCMFPQSCDLRTETARSL